MEISKYRQSLLSDVTVNRKSKASRREQLHALSRVAKFRPKFTLIIILGGTLTALFEGIGLSFILPIIEVVQSSGDPTTEADGLLSIFLIIYNALGIPLSLGYLVLGVSVMLAVRWSLTFIMRWFKAAIEIYYIREIQTRSLSQAVEARIEFFEKRGSDNILNAIVTQAEYAGEAIRYMITLFEQSLLSLLYISIAFIIDPYLTIFTIIALGGVTAIFRRVVEPGYELGDEVAQGNEDIQEIAQATTQGVRDVKLFGMKSELLNDFAKSVNRFTQSSIRLRRNEQAIKNFYSLFTAVSVFALIFFAVEFANLSIGSFGIFLFAIFRAAPVASNLNTTMYRVENNLPHLVRAQAFVNELECNSESVGSTETVPSTIKTIEFDDVRFSYPEQDDEAISDISFKIHRHQFIGFVGKSGAGKSTIISLLTRMYDPDTGEIRANDHPIHEMEIDAWRSKLAVVRQNPFIFDDTLRYNLTIGNRDVSTAELNQVCQITKVNEFLNNLPNGYETHIGDDGVRLSGGQRQRVALARALLKDAEILVLDEATSDLDSELERQVQAAIESMNQNYTVIGIAHRLSTIENADVIYTVDNGEIIEVGSHEQLLRSGEKYANLYNIQS